MVRTSLNTGRASGSSVSSVHYTCQPLHNCTFKHSTRSRSSEGIQIYSGIFLILDRNLDQNFSTALRLVTYRLKVLCAKVCESAPIVPYRILTSTKPAPYRLTYQQLAQTCSQPQSCAIYPGICSSPLSPCGDRTKAPRPGARTAEPWRCAYA